MTKSIGGQSMAEIRIEQLKSTAFALATELGADVKSITLELEHPNGCVFTVNQAQKLHEKLQDELDFRVQGDECNYKKDHLNITFEVEA